MYMWFPIRRNSFSYVPLSGTCGCAINDKRYPRSNRKWSTGRFLQLIEPNCAFRNVCSMEHRTTHFSGTESAKKPWPITNVPQFRISGSALYSLISTMLEMLSARPRIKKTLTNRIKLANKLLQVVCTTSL